MSMIKTPTPEPTNRRSRGKWARGVSGNPAGRPQGSRNKSTLLLENLLQSRQEELFNKTIEMALSGDSIALRLCVERLLPIMRERPIEVALPSEVKTLDQATDAVSSILSGIAEGEITPSEGAVLTNIVEAQKRLIEAQQAEAARGGMEQENAKLEAELEAKLQPVILAQGGESPEEEVA